MHRVVVIGAGVGGLTTAALLARKGFDVTVLEAHVYPGGCAGTFFHKKYKFDAGATLAAGFGPGSPMELIAQEVGLTSWPVKEATHIMDVHLPSGQIITRWADARREAARADAFGQEGMRFWRWQEKTADAMWDLALRLPPWPPQSFKQLLQLASHGTQWLASAPLQRLRLGLFADALRPVAAHLKHAPEALRLFIDAQLLIAAQATSAKVNAMYGASALDLPRRGVVHVKGGMGGLAETLAQAVQQNGGTYLKRQEVTKIQIEEGKPKAVETARGESFPADIVVANLTPWNISALMGAQAPPKLRSLTALPEDGWGAFMTYVGLDASVIPKQDFALHHQVIQGEPMGETNTVFLSFAPQWDDTRAPTGLTPLTLSTHTSLKDWWRLFREDKAAYEARKEEYAQKMLKTASRALPGLRDAAQLVLPGTPVTFQRFTKRKEGWVGGFPQTNLFRAWPSKLGKGLWMVGDSIFPGQSTAAVALGGLRVAKEIIERT